MAYTYVLSTEFSFPNISVYTRYWNETEFSGYRINANEGYVFYDTTANDTEIDPETMEERPVIYYRTLAYLPRNYNMDNFPYVAVPRDSVDENYIFGVGDNDHVIA